jgi:hypothetical protein
MHIVCLIYLWDVPGAGKLTEGREVASRAVLVTCFPLDSCLASSILKMEATCSSETSVEFQRTTRHCIPEDRPLQNHRCENLRSFTEESLMCSATSPVRRFWFPSYVENTGCSTSLEPMGILFIIYIICSICSPRHSTHSLSRFNIFLRILVNILGSTVAQQSVIQDVWH